MKLLTFNLFLVTPTDWKPTPFGFTPDEIRSVMLEKNVDERKAIKMLKDRERTRARRKRIKDDYEFETQEEERLRRNERTRRRRAILRGETSQDIDLSEQEQKRIVERSYEKMSADDILYEKIKNAQRRRMRRRELKAKNVYGDAKSGPESSESDG